MRWGVVAVAVAVVVGLVVAVLVIGYLHSRYLWFLTPILIVLVAIWLLRGATGSCILLLFWSFFLSY